MRKPTACIKDPETFVKVLDPAREWSLRSLIVPDDGTGDPRSIETEPEVWSWLRDPLMRSLEIQADLVWPQVVDLVVDKAASGRMTLNRDRVEGLFGHRKREFLGLLANVSLERDSAKVAAAHGRKWLDELENERKE